MASEKIVNYSSENHDSAPDCKSAKPSSPRQFFARLYGHLEDTKKSGSDSINESESDICRPQPLVSSGIGFPMFGGPLTTFPFNFPPRDDAAIRLALATSPDAHLAGFSAFCKYF